jgi:Receptor family ligand binding region
MFQMETALMYDSVLLFAKALHWLVHSQRVTFHPLNCDTVENWEHGFSLVNYMKSVSAHRFSFFNLSNAIKSIVKIHKFRPKI